MEQQGPAPRATVEVGAERGQQHVSAGLVAQRLAELGIAIGVDVVSVSATELGRLEEAGAGRVGVLEEDADVRVVVLKAGVGADGSEVVVGTIAGLILADRLYVDGGRAGFAEPQRVAGVEAGELIARLLLEAVCGVDVLAHAEQRLAERPQALGAAAAAPLDGSRHAELEIRDRHELQPPAEQVRVGRAAALGQFPGEEIGVPGPEPGQQEILEGAGFGLAPTHRGHRLGRSVEDEAVAPGRPPVAALHRRVEAAAEEAGADAAPVERPGVGVAGPPGAAEAHLHGAVEEAGVGAQLQAAIAAHLRAQQQGHVIAGAADGEGGAVGQGGLEP